MENFGYKYRDVVNAPILQDSSLSTDGRDILYATTNPETRFGLLNPTKFKVVFQFYDMKWLSNVINFSMEIEDPDVLAGLKEGNITIDFSRLEKSDRESDSKFITGGRAYYEAEVLGYKISSFTQRGFFDKLNYREPSHSGELPFYE